MSGPERFRIKIHTECPEEDRDELLDWLRDIDRDPVAKLDGLPCFLKFEDSYEPEFGETVTVKVADVKRGSFATAVVLDKGRKDE